MFCFFKHTHKHTHTYQAIWRVSRGQSSAHIPVWLRTRPTLSQGGTENEGRCCHQPTRFPWLQTCGWWRAVWWLLPGVGGCWHHSGESSASPLWTHRVLIRLRTSGCSVCEEENWRKTENNHDSERYTVQKFNTTDLWLQPSKIQSFKQVSFSDSASDPQRQHSTIQPITKGQSSDHFLDSGQWHFPS